MDSTTTKNWAKTLMMMTNLQQTQKVVNKKTFYILTLYRNVYRPGTNPSVPTLWGIQRQWK